MKYGSGGVTVILMTGTKRWHNCCPQGQHREEAGVQEWVNKTLDFNTFQTCFLFLFFIKHKIMEYQVGGLFLVNLSAMMQTLINAFTFDTSISSE